MNQLDPDLKRLFKWARPQVSSTPAPEPPTGFATRVVAGSMILAGPLPFPGLQRYLAATACLAILVIACGSFVMAKLQAPKFATDLSSAAHFLAKNIAP